MVSTFVLSTSAHPGHLFPMLGLARALGRAGHRVVVHAPASERAPVEAAGAALTPFERHRDFFTSYVDQVLAPRGDGWAPLRPVRQRTRLLVEQHLTRVLPFALPPHKGRALAESAFVMAGELAGVIRDAGADCVLASSFCFGAGYAAELTSVPYATLGTDPVLSFDAEGWTALPGLFLADRVPPPALRRLLDALIPLRGLRRRLGLPARAPNGLSELFRTTFSDELHLVPAHRELARRTPWPGHTYVGPIHFDWPPAGEMAGVEDGTVLVSTTTMPGREYGLLRRILEAIAPMKVPVLATAGSADDLPPHLGDHVRIEPFVAHGQVLPRARALVTHGGWGALGRALRHGVPALVIPPGGPSLVVAARAAELGLVRHLPLGEATPARIREELESLLSDVALHERLRRLAAALAAGYPEWLQVKPLVDLASRGALGGRRAAG
jgi:UDP:flavonoid glycosyltransferase YjiC (YdhE family)